jgi:hypothetical protein
MSHTDLNRVVAGKKREHANDSGQPRTLPIRYDAHGYARCIHAQVRSGSLALSDEIRIRGGVRDGIRRHCSGWQRVEAYRRTVVPMRSMHTEVCQYLASHA